MNSYRSERRKRRKFGQGLRSFWSAVASGSLFLLFPPRPHATAAASCAHSKRGASSGAPGSPARPEPREAFGVRRACSRFSTSVSCDSGSKQGKRSATTLWLSAERFGLVPTDTG